ncbi:MAG: hypothetical protein ACM3VS_08250, partial [Candidatus Dadabacteria bacterium]
AIALAGLAFYSTILHPSHQPSVVSNEAQTDSLSNTDSALFSKKPPVSKPRRSAVEETPKKEKTDTLITTEKNTQEILPEEPPVHQKKKKVPVEEQPNPVEPDTTSNQNSTNQQLHGEYNNFSSMNTKSGSKNLLTPVNSEEQ